MLTLCWSAKGGSGTTVVAAALALATDAPSLLVDLDGDLPAVLGLDDRDHPGVHDWLRSTATDAQLDGLAIDVDPFTRLVPSGRPADPDSYPPTRWQALADRLRTHDREVIVDAGSAPPHGALLAAADRRLLVLRPCYLALRSATAQGCLPTGIVLVTEPGRALRAADIELAVGAPVAAELLLDPAVARAVDSGLLTSRLPQPYRRRLRDVA